MKCKLLYKMSLLSSLFFVLSVLWDYSKYNSSINSAPFYVWIMFDVVYFILPAICFSILGRFAKEKGNNILKSK